MRVFFLAITMAFTFAAPAAGVAAKFKVHNDIVYFKGEGYNDEKHRLDVYVPDGAAGADVLFFTHGGAWVIGDRKQYTYVGRAFAKQGLVTVVISYRLSPEVQHPGHIRDVAAAFAWTYRNIEKYGGDSKRIFISGQSAGGHLTALLFTNGKYLKEQGLDAGAIRGAIPISGVYDFRMQAIKLHHSKMQQFTRAMFMDDDSLRNDASPIMNVKKGLPPILIIVAKRDPLPLREQAEDFRDALVKAGETPEYVFLENEGHVSELVRIGKKPDPISGHALKFIKFH